MKTKIPPPIIAVTCIFANYLSTYVITPFNFSNQGIVGSVIFVFGFASALSAILLFRKKQTTVDPMKPEESTSLVTSGIFSYTRNPMYLGLFIVITSTVIFFGAWFGIIILCFFVWYINTFQIIPEEEAMQKLFGKKFEEYSQNVRRWI